MRWQEQQKDNMDEWLFRQFKTYTFNRDERYSVIPYSFLYTVNNSSAENLGHWNSNGSRSGLLKFVKNITVQDRDRNKFNLLYGTEFKDPEILDAYLWWRETYKNVSFNWNDGKKMWTFNYIMEATGTYEFREVSKDRLKYVVQVLGTCDNFRSYRRYYDSNNDHRCAYAVRSAMMNRIHNGYCMSCFFFFSLFSCFSFFHFC